MPDDSNWGPPVVDPMNLRSMLMLDVARELMITQGWRHRALAVSMRDPEDETEAAPVTFLGVNDPHALAEVAAGRLDVATVNPVVVLNMARRGTGPFAEPLDLSTIAVLPHYDQLAFAVSNRLGMSSLGDIKDRRYPLRVSVRGSLDEVTRLSIDVVLGVYGFSLADIISWGGAVFYDQPMPNDASRLGRLGSGDIDAIFEEGTITWVDGVAAAEASILPIDNERLAELEQIGFRRGVLDRQTYPSLSADIQTVDYSGWPIYCRTTASDEQVEQICGALVAAKDRIVWSIGPADQPPLPLAQMVRDTPATPLDVPLHPAAEAYWRRNAYLGR